MSEVELDFDGIAKETDRAILFIVDAEEDETVWIPRSVIIDIDEKRGSVFVQQWFAEAVGLI